MTIELVIATAATLSLALDVYVLLRERQDRKRLADDEARLDDDEQLLRNYQGFDGLVLSDEWPEHEEWPVAAGPASPEVENWLKFLFKPIEVKETVED